MQMWLDYAAMYIAAAYVVINLPLRSEYRQFVFALLNTLGTFFVFFYPSPDEIGHLFLLCFAEVLIFYIFLCYYSLQPGILSYALALLSPVAVLVCSKLTLLPSVVGFSYLAFRLSYLAYELNTKKTTLPSLSNYLSFAFFPLTYLIGPISPYHYYGPSLEKPDPSQTPLKRSLGRILVGMLKCYVLSPVFKTMSFEVLWFDGYYHGISDFAIACWSSMLYFYFNFAGACDIIIGGAGLLNIRVKENFDNPLMARNLRDFWNRMHITLSHYLRDIVFTPGTLYFTRLTRGRHVHLITMAMITVTFLLMGLWHGVGVNFVILGLLHGVGLSVYYLYSLWFKTFPVSLQRFLNSKPMEACSIALTFSYVSFSVLFLLNSWTDIKAIFLLLFRL